MVRMSFIKDQWINIIVIILITAVLGCILGLAMTTIVDRRLSGISIQMPKIQLRSDPEELEQVYEDFTTTEVSDDERDIIREVPPPKVSPQVTPPPQSTLSQARLQRNTPASLPPSRQTSQPIMRPPLHWFKPLLQPPVRPMIQPILPVRRMLVRKTEYPKWISIWTPTTTTTATSITTTPSTDVNTNPTATPSGKSDARPTRIVI